MERSEERCVERSDEYYASSLRSSFPSFAPLYSLSDKYYGSSLDSSFPSFAPHYSLCDEYYDSSLRSSFLSFAPHCSLSEDYRRLVAPLLVSVDRSSLNHPASHYRSYI